MSTGEGAYDESSVMARRRRTEDGGGSIAGSESMRTAIDWMLLNAAHCGDLSAPGAGEGDAFEFAETGTLFWRPLPICSEGRTCVSSFATRELSRTLSSVSSELCQEESTSIDECTSTRAVVRMSD